ncbi:MAG: GH92 family glycosyl hydrolase [Marinilabiliales bacterium]|nr:GH92 family glycosyl hydrolase [Marinilabiliales bacterium]
MKRLALILPCLLMLAGFSLQVRAAGKDYTGLVNPMVGTDGHGHTFPGATLPFGMIQLSPDTRTDTWDGCSGYHYSDRSILGFSHTHFSGTGVGSGADILLMPGIGKIRMVPGKPGSSGEGYRCNFSHKNEIASPGYYSVGLDNGILAELTCTERVGLHHYTFPSWEEGHVILDLAHGITTRVDSLFLEIPNDSTVTGFRHANASLDGDKKIYFVIRFSRPFLRHGISDKGKLLPNGEKAGGKEIRAFFDFGKVPSGGILAKVALSRVDMEGAWKNMQSELPGWDFMAVKEQARIKWQKELERVELEGGTTAQQRTFYTALYHCLIHPNIAFDADRRYFGTDHRIHQADDLDYYTTFSLWDTFRALHPLFTILYPDKTNQFVRNFIERYRHYDSMMIMEFGGNEGFGMIGYHSLSVVADAYVKGLRDYDTKLALEAMKQLSEGIRAGKELYKTMGFIPCDFDDQSVSKTLEYAYDDWCVSRLAKDLSKEDFHKYSQKGQFYQHLYDPSTGFMRGRLQDYHWQIPFDPRSTSNFTEGNAYQFSLFVPQDYQGLFKKMGGDEATDQWLDRCFTTEMDEAQAKTGDMTGNIGQYVHGNEPSHHMAYLYNYLGKPWKTQERVRQILETLYSDQPDGLSGNEDCGQMSAWYVISALGFYAATPGMDYYVMGSPLFPKATIHLENGKNFVIHAPAADKEHKYIQNVKLNGKEYIKSYLPHSMIVKGGELLVEMGPEANKNFGQKIADRPWSESYPTPMMPAIETPEGYFKGSTEIRLTTSEPECTIRYTLDGSDPTEKSPKYSAPFQLDHSALLKARCFAKDKNPSFPASKNYIALQPRPALSVTDVQSGIRGDYFEGYCVKLADMKKYPILSQKVLGKFDITDIRDSRSFGYFFDALLLVPETGIYTLFLNSNDGSNLVVDGQTELINDGFHRAQERVCKVELEKGYHSVRVDYFQMGGAKALTLSWQPPHGKKEEIPASQLFHSIKP